MSEEVHKEYERLRSYEHRQKQNEYSHTVCSFDDLDKIADSTDIEAEVEKRELLDRVFSVIKAELTDDERKIVMGFYLDGLTSEKLSDLLGLTSDNVRQKKARALKKIRDIINKEND